MKKMQCEVCGGTTIKKIDDTIFECQSCGVQYGKEEIQKLLVEIEGTVEVTGTVKIDRSEEVDNAIKRAEQFYEKGDKEKAEEYYNKVLDIDPDNAVANAKVNIINAKENEASIVLLKQTVSSEEGTKIFLNSLKNQSNMVPDIYKEIEIISNETEFNRISLYRGNYKGRYTGTACYEREVSYIEYEEKRERLNNGSYVTKTVPVTKYRTEVDKAPVSGFFENDISRCYLMSDSLYKKLSAINDSGIAEVASRADGITTLVENFFEENLSKISEEFFYVNIDDLDIENGKALYNGITVDTIIAREPQERAEKRFNYARIDSCSSYVEKYLIPGDFSEDVHLDYDHEEFSLMNLFIPIQVIEYAYRGKFYIAMLILNEKADAISMTYPMYKSLDVAEKEEEIKTLDSKRNDLSMVLLMSFGAVVASFVAMVIGTMVIGEAAKYIPPIAIAACIYWIISSIIKNVKLNTEIKKAKDLRENKLSNISSLHKKVMNETSKAFFDNYDNESIEGARKAAFSANDFSVNLSEVFTFGIKFSSSIDHETIH